MGYDDDTDDLLPDEIDLLDGNRLLYDKKSDKVIIFELPDVLPYTRELKLKNGTRMHGDDVKQLQGWLIGFGYLPRGEDDGYFGPKTESALKAWQRSNGFTPDGVMSKAVYDRLYGD